MRWFAFELMLALAVSNARPHNSKNPASGRGWRRELVFLMVRSIISKVVIVLGIARVLDDM